MMLKKILLPTLFLAIGGGLVAQNPFKPNLKLSSSSVKQEIAPMKNIRKKVPASQNTTLRKLTEPNYNYNLSFSTPDSEGFILLKNEKKQVVAIQSDVQLEANKSTSIQNHLTKCAAVWELNPTQQELKTTSVESDNLNMEHHRIAHYYKGVKIWNDEAVVHINLNSQSIYFTNGKIKNIEGELDVAASVSAEHAIAKAKEDIDQQSAIKKSSNTFEWESERKSVPQLVIYYSEDLAIAPTLVWQFSMFPSLIDRWEYFVNAKTGAILHKYQNICKFHHGTEGCHHEDTEQRLMADGPEVGSGKDLLGVTRTVNSYKVGSTNYLIDASKSMFKLSSSSLPDNPVGAIWTLDAFNTSPNENNFRYDNIKSSTKDFAHAGGISAHYNASVAFDYYKNTFSRNSIDGKGGTIISLVNVADDGGVGMDNAFWNGEAMFYGNGASAFFPLARGLDVAGHEMTHGVVQSTANLEYQGESGALNESFADIFGAMIDRDDWRMGEDVVRTSAFPSGALRDLSNPHNGGTSLNSPGYQPAHYSERYTGTQDNGGVHINSGIPNFAFFKFANDANVGKTKAEQVFYRALSVYLVKSSKFLDLRAAVVQSVKDLGYGSTVEAAANNAFTAVGIGSGTSTTGSGNTYQNDLPINPGNDLILVNDDAMTKIYVTNPQGNPIEILTDTPPLSKPSVSDDGTEVMFVGQDKKIYYITIDWQTGEVTEEVLQSQPIWRNLAMSKDGYRVAALLETKENAIEVYDFDREEWKTFTLYTPTTGSKNTSEIQYAESMEWDYSGQYVIFDASNQLSGGLFGNIEYWDVNFLRAYNPAATNFGDGQVFKLFSSLPDGISIGNPAFAKNSPYIIAFDMFDENKSSTQAWSIVGVNIENGNQGTIFQNSSVPGVPNYSRDDKKILFNAKSSQGADVVAISSLQADKIQASGSATVLFTEATNGVWFANGYRKLTDTKELSNNVKIKYNNPVVDQLVINAEQVLSGTTIFRVFSSNGTLLRQVSFENASNFILDMNSLTSGMYHIQLLNNGVSETLKVVKQ